jgi:hypothetical protein
MENRTAIRGATVSKGLVMLFAVLVAIGLGVMAAFVAKNLTAPAGGTETRVVATQPGPDAQDRHNEAIAAQAGAVSDGQYAWGRSEHLGSPKTVDNQPSSAASDEPLVPYDQSGYGFV